MIVAEYIFTKYPNLEKSGPFTQSHSADPSGDSKLTSFKFENENKD